MLFAHWAGGTVTLTKRLVTRHRRHLCLRDASRTTTAMSPAKGLGKAKGLCQGAQQGKIVP